jgi:hypothetical protein
MELEVAMKHLLLFILPCILTACAAIAPAPTTEQTPAPISTGKIVALTKAVIMTGEAETETEVSPKNNATVMAILATKFAGGTEAAETMTALPTLTLTPAIPSDSSLCHPIDLKASYRSGPLGAMMGMFSISVGFRNINNSPCYFQTWPQVILLDGQGKPLDVDYGYFDPSGVDAVVAATEQARESATAKVGLWPGWEAWINLNWGNWCERPLIGGVIIRLTLINDIGTIHVPTDIRSGGVCNAPGYRSYINISKVGITPPSK